MAQVGEQQQQRLLSEVMWIRALVLLIAAASSAQVAAAPAEVCANQLDLQRHACIHSGDPAPACLEVIASEPKRLTATFSLCDLAVAQGNFDKANALLDDAKNVHVGDSFALGLIRRARSNVAEARSAETSVKGDIEVLAEYLAIRCESLRNLDACAELIGLRPDDPVPNNILGEAALTNTEFTSAIRYFTTSLELDGGQTEIAQALSRARRGREELVDDCLHSSGNRAVDACRKARLHGADDEVSILVRLGDLNIERRQRTEAREYFEEAAALEPGGSAKGRLALLSYTEGCVSGGRLSDCEQAYNSTPQTGIFSTIRKQVSRERCLLMLKTTRLIEARTACDQAIKQDPAVATEVNTRFATKALSDCEVLYDSGDMAAAIGACELARDLLDEPALIAKLEEIIEQIQLASAPYDPGRSGSQDPVQEQEQEQEQEPEPTILLAGPSNEPILRDSGSVVTY